MNKDPKKSKYIPFEVALQFDLDVATLQQQLINEVEKQYTREEMVDELLKCRHFAPLQHKNDFNSLILHYNLFYLSNYNIESKLLENKKGLKEAVVYFENYLQKINSEALQLMVVLIKKVLDYFDDVYRLELG